MKRINILSKQTSQLIAAGEVVERPASVIKELLENSIDAGATRITVEIKNGGNKLIKITDNGCGIYRDDVKNAFLRHATSKLKNSEDLENISSLGFRGEALASVCAVSRVEIITKSPEEEVGTQFFINGGEPEKLLDIGCTNGTTIFVRDLFYNTPARMKFLKKDVTEANACAGIIDKIALSHPEVSFKFINNGKETLRTTGDKKIASAIYCVYGKSFFDGMIPIKYEYNGIKIDGYISKPIFSKASRSMQNFFLNGRYIKSKTASSALEEAFKNSVMIGKFPYCVIYIDVNPRFVDVNTHPTKTEVKFSNEKLIFETIYYSTKNALMNYNNASSALKPNFYITPKSNDNTMESITDAANSKNMVSETAQGQTVNSDKKENFNFNLISEITPGGEMPLKSPEFKTDFFFKSEKQNKYTFNYPKNKTNSEKTFFDETVQKSSKNIQENLFAEEENKATKVNLIGEIFNCYIIIESDDEIILVDKHAAHERIIFEKLKSSNFSHDSQKLIEPIIVTLEKNEFGAIIDNLATISQAGIEAESFGSGSIIVRSIPMYMKTEEVENCIIEIARYLIKNLKSINTEKLDWIYHNIACRSAIKAGDKTSEKEILELIKKLSANPNIKHCPHGRPIFVNLSKKFIEKQFGRT